MRGLTKEDGIGARRNVYDVGSPTEGNLLLQAACTSTFRHIVYN